MQSIGFQEELEEIPLIAALHGEKRDPNQIWVNWDFLLHLIDLSDGESSKAMIYLPYMHSKGTALLSLLAL